jgi:hypothetical protein
MTNADRSPLANPDARGSDSRFIDVPTRDNYDRDAVQEILQLAIARRQDIEQYSRSQLLELADEIGIDRTDLYAAEQRWLAQNGDRSQRQQFVAAQRQRLKLNLGKFGIVNGFLLLIDLVSSGHLGWSLTLGLGWGMFIALDAWKSLQPDTEDFKKRFQKWQLQQKTVDDWD